MKRNIKSLLKFFLLSAVTVVFTVLLFRIFKASNPAGFESVGAARAGFVIGKGIEPLGPLDVSYNFCGNEKIKRTTGTFGILFRFHWW